MKTMYSTYKEHIVLIIFPIILIICMFIISYEKVEIISITPEHISNVEANMGMSVNGLGFKPNDIIYIDGKSQATTFGNEGWLTCFIPKNIDTNQKGITIQVRRESGIIDTKSNKKKLRIIKVEDE